MKKFNEKSLVTAISKYLAFSYSQKEVTEKTRINNQCMVNNILSFLEYDEIYNAELEDVDIDFILRFQEWASEIYDKTGVYRHINILKRSLDLAVSKGLVPYNPIKMFQTELSKPKPKVILTETELDLLSIYISKDRLKNLSAYYYLLQAETGMSYGDLLNYTIKEKDGIKCLVNSRIKTGRQYWVPLSKRALELIERYKTKPHITNLDYNKNIKLVAKDLGIKKHLTTHTARKTFATRMFDSGWSVESIASMMGITILILTRHYINVSENRILNEYLKRQSV